MHFSEQPRRNIFLEEKKVTRIVLQTLLFDENSAGILNNEYEMQMNCNIFTQDAHVSSQYLSTQGSCKP